MLKTLRNPLIVIGALLVAAGGVIHLQQWRETYRHVASAAQGWFVPRIGFPLDAAVSAMLAIALIVVVVRPLSRKTSAIIVAAALAFELSSLGALIASRTGSVFGWSESGWTSGAASTRAVEIGAIATLGIALVSVLYSEPRRAKVTARA